MSANGSRMPAGAMNASTAAESALHPEPSKVVWKIDWQARCWVDAKRILPLQFRHITNPFPMVDAGLATVAAYAAMSERQNSLRCEVICSTWLD